MMADSIRDEVRAALLDPEFLKVFAEALVQAYLDTPLLFKPLEPPGRDAMQEGTSWSLEEAE